LNDIYDVPLPDRLVEEKVLVPQPDIEVPEIPMDLSMAVKLKEVNSCSQQARNAPVVTQQPPFCRVGGMFQCAAGRRVFVLQAAIATHTVWLCGLWPELARCL